MPVTKETRGICPPSLLRARAVKRALFFSCVLALFGCASVFCLVGAAADALVFPVPLLFSTVVAVMGCVLFVSPLYEGITLCAFLAREGERRAISALFYFYTARGAYAYALRRGFARALRVGIYLGGMYLVCRVGTVLARMLYRSGLAVRGTLLLVLTVLLLGLYTCFFLRLGREAGVYTPLYYLGRLSPSALRRVATERLRPYRRVWWRVRLLGVLLLVLCVVSLGLAAYFCLPYYFLLRASCLRRILLDQNSQEEK